MLQSKTQSKPQPKPQSTPFHSGERAVQERMGVREQIEPFARRVVRPFMPEEHRTFYSSLPFVALAARDETGRPWATLLAGEHGFITTPDARTLKLAAGLAPGDALEAGLEPGADVGLLGIEFSTRRRNRVNGRVAPRGAGSLTVSVDQSFGNCPQYIHPREWIAAPRHRQPSAGRYDRLTTAATEWIEQADTFFIASGHREAGEEAFFGMDASHRGGEPGFVKVLDDRTLVFPDYAGNNHFNTIGNLVMDPSVGLLFVDFEQGSLLQLSGTATIDWSSDAVAEIPGARRLVQVSVERVVLLRDALPIRWKQGGDALRSLRVVEKRRESADVTSFVLEARDGGELPDFEPGQHLPLEVALPGQSQRVLRSYSLSSAPNGSSYRLSIKREPEGVVSRFLHDETEPGDFLSARVPAGDFVLRPGARPVVLISAGVGLTPMLSMLEALSANHEQRPVWFLHGVRDGLQHPLAEEVKAATALTDRIRAHVSYSQPRSDDVAGRDYDHEGRVDGELIAGLLPTLDADFYLCGPVAFMGEVAEDLVERGVPEAQIHSESFGPRG